MTHQPDQTTFDAAGRTLRHDGWTPDRQRAFLTAIADGETVERACRLVQMTVSSAYALKQRAAGQQFALGWRAANLLARDAIADRMLARAIDGQVETVTRPDGSTYSRHRYDNRAAMALLTRLDRQAEQLPADPAAAAHAQAARLVSQDWEAYLDLVEADRGPASAGLFLARRTGADAPMEPVLALARADAFLRTGASLADDLPIADLDPARRADWTAEQWARAEACGLVVLAPPALEDDDDDFEGWDDDACEPPVAPLVDDAQVWWDDGTATYRTCLAPPPGEAAPEEVGRYGTEWYDRGLTDSERDLMERADALDVNGVRAEAEAERAAWFDQVRADIEAAEATIGSEALSAAPATEQSDAPVVSPASHDRSDA